MKESIPSILLSLILAAIALAFSPGASAQRHSILTFRTSESVQLRWRGVHKVEIAGYHVYRRIDGGEWSRLTPQPLRRVNSVSDARAMAGYKAELFLTLLGAGDPPRDPDDAMYARVFADPRGEAFFSIVCLVNPELGRLLGEMFTDTTAPAGARAEYRVTALEGASENKIGVTPALVLGIADSIPPVELLDAEPREESVVLAWERDTAALSNGTIVSYNVYRADRILGPYELANPTALLPAVVRSKGAAPPAVQQFVDEYLETGRTYFYFVRAVNAFGIESDPSPSVEVVPRKTTAPNPPSNLRVVRFGAGARLEWDGDSVQRIAGYEVFRAGGSAPSFTRSHPLSGALRSRATLWIDPFVADGETVRYFVRTVDSGGARSSSDTILYVAPDERPPSPPADVVATPGQGRISIHWRRGRESDLLGYEIERATGPAFSRLFLLTGKPVGDTVFVDTMPATSELTYGYVVYAVDRRYNRSGASVMVHARLRDIVPPRRPIITSLLTSGDTVVLRWTGGSAPDLARYDVHRAAGPTAKSMAIGSSRERLFRDRPGAHGLYLYSVSALDSAGNESPHSQPMSLRYDDVSPVPPIESGSAVLRKGAIIVSWNAPASPRIAGFTLVRIRIRDSMAVSMGDFDRDRREFRDTHAKTGEEYRYVLRTRDSAWRMSEPIVVTYRPGK